MTLIVRSCTTTPMEPENTMTKATQTPAEAKPVADVKAPKYLTGAEAIDKAIASIQSRGKKLDRDIWQAALSAMQHHAKHGDVTLVNRLVEAMPKGSRVNALRDYISTFGKVTYNEETKAFDHDATGNFDAEGAGAVCWTECKPEPDYSPYDALADIRKIVKNLTAENPKRKDVTDAKHRTAILTLAAQLGVEA